MAGPSGFLRPCSQLRSVWTLMPIAWANWDCERPTKRLSAATSSPDSNLPSHQTLAHASRNRTSQLFLGKFRNVRHSAPPWTWLR